MAKYKKVNEGIIDKFIEKVFTKIAKNQRSKAIDDLAKKDPEFAKGYEGLKQMYKDMNRELNTKAKRDAALRRILKSKNPYK